MPEENPQLPSAPEVSVDLPPALAPPHSPIAFDIGEEIGTANKNLPPKKIVGIVVGVIAIIAGIVAFVQKPRQKATGVIANVLSAEVPDQNITMVAVEVSVNNQGAKPFVPREVKVEIQTDKGNFTDQAASAVDVPRYLQAFPALSGDGTPPLQFENPIPAGAQTKGVIVVTFPVTADELAHRKQLQVTLTGPDQLVPLILTK
jgi:hypothetical protein